jgi:endonuclease/exonuclease/phosphatase family metal-dependent hydrolase
MWISTSLALSALMGCAAPAQPWAPQRPGILAQAGASPASPRAALATAARAPAPVTAAGAATAPAAAAPQLRGTALAAEAVPFDVLTFNTWGKPGILGTDLKRRFRLIADAVRGHDVVGMQETFTGYAAGLEEAAGYPYFLRPRNGGFLKLNAGLTVMAKHPIVETDFAAFEKAAHADAFARKGVLFARLDVPGAGKVDVFDTHFQAQSGAKYDAIRMHDVEVLASLVEKHRAGNPTFIFGDFNSRPDSAAYAAIMDRLPVRDAFVQANPGDPGYTVDPLNPHKKPTAPYKRIDFVFVMDGDHLNVRVDAASVVFNTEIGGTFLSDHYGLNARCSLVPRP